MTGLDVERHRIVEIACLVTDGLLRTSLEGPDLVVHQPEAVLADINGARAAHTHTSLSFSPSR